MTHLGHYWKLVGHEVTPCSAEEWSKVFEKNRDRIIAQTMFSDIMVSTVFVGLNYSFTDGPPEIFETMVFGGEFDQHCERCATWEQAEEIHARTCANVARSLAPRLQMHLGDSIDENGEIGLRMPVSIRRPRTLGKILHEPPEGDGGTPPASAEGTPGTE